MNLKNLVIANAAMTMTLKEITDLLEVEHNKAMNKVEKMAEDPEFGTVAKTSTVYNDKWQTTKAYQKWYKNASLNTLLLIYDYI